MKTARLYTGEITELRKMMKKEITCIYFSNDKLKFARARGLAHAKEITDIVVKDIAGLSESDISQTIKASFNEIGCKTSSVLSAIPSNLVITKNIEIPASDPKEIQEIINLQSSRHTPYAREEIVIDYINVGVYRQNYSKILMIIVPQKVIKRHLSILSAAGLDIAGIFISSEGICRMYSYLSKVKTETNPVSIIHINDNYSDFTVALRGKMIFVRNLPIGINNFLAEKERAKERFIEEVKKSLESYQNEDIERTPSQIILTGAIEEIKDIESTLNSILYIPTMLLFYFDHLPVGKDALSFASGIRQLSFLDIISPLFTSEELNVNLVPKEVKLTKAFEERGKDIIKMGILIMAAFVLICAILMSKIYLKSSYLQNLTAKYQPAVQETQGLEKSFTRARVVKNYLSTRGCSLEVLSELFNVIPEDIYLENIRLNEEGELSIKGTSESMSTVFTLVGKMEDSQYFQNAKSKYTTKRKEGEKDLTDFQISCSLREFGR